MQSSSETQMFFWKCVCAIEDITSLNTVLMQFYIPIELYLIFVIENYSYHKDKKTESSYTVSKLFACK